jgi:hypothetical protein
MTHITPVLDPIDTALQAPEPRGNYLAYPVSRLAAKIIPQDLTNFKSRGVSRVERELQQEMVEIQERYMEVIDAFNWNKLIYESHFGFEPVFRRRSTTSTKSAWEAPSQHDRARKVAPALDRKLWQLRRAQCRCGLAAEWQNSNEKTRQDLRSDIRAIGCKPSVGGLGH